MLVKASQNLLDKIDELERSCAYNGKYAQCTVNGAEVEDLYLEDGVLQAYCIHTDTLSTVELDEDGMFDLDVYLVSYEDVTDQFIM